MHSAVKIILSEISSVLERVDEAEVAEFVNVILPAKRIVTAGAGRVGLATKGFAMRLGHLGYNAFALGDMTVPGLKPSDLLVVASGSGETPTIAHITEQAKKSDATIALITGNPDSRMGKLADVRIVLPAPNKSSSGSIRTIQPMTTLNEQCLNIFFDALVLVLMERTGSTEKHMWERHSNLE